MAEDSALPFFTGGELALADTVILLLKVLSMHGIIDEEGAKTVFAELEARYRAQHFHSAAAMVEYLRTHAADADHESTPVRVRNLIDESQGEA